MITRSVRGSLFLAGGLIVIALAMTAVESRGWLGADMDTRIVQALIGGILALFGNALGKRTPGSPVKAEPPGMGAARRFFGLALVVGGLVHAFAWLLAPLDIANWLSMAAVVLAMIAGLVRVAFTIGKPAGNSD